MNISFFLVGGGDFRFLVVVVVGGGGAPRCPPPPPYLRHCPFYSISTFFPPPRLFGVSRVHVIHMFTRCIHTFLLFFLLNIFVYHYTADIIPPPPPPPPPTLPLPLLVPPPLPLPLPLHRFFFVRIPKFHLSLIILSCPSNLSLNLFLNYS